ncbi:magnesium transporter [Lichtheimia corymbifera JMRC:FSU:9682]|uniref:Magnesium transporter n=1 Tax=Lichtheimia corymbifera JMRC:FSU:9682 TaxID=1263082 RepID=A0A068RJZ9_9FUNG|nr:magnesium transporter [Lichtheimia corymbifera JMRC:FSU:9682]
MSLPNDESFIRQSRHVNRSFSLPFTQELRSRRRLSDQQQQQQLPQHHPYSSLDRTPTVPHDDQFAEEWPVNEAQDVEADVLFPQYKIESHDHADMEAFNEMLDRKMSADTETLKLSKTLSKHTRSDQKSEMDAYGTRFWIYTVRKDGEPTQEFHQLLSEEGRQILDRALKTPGWWVDVQSPTTDDMKALSKTFHIHPLTTEDVLAQEPREKVEMFPNYTFICFRSFQIDPYTEQICPFNFYILIFRQGLLTFHFRSSDIPQKVRQRTEQLKTYMVITPDWLNYAIIDAIVDEFGPTILQVEMEAVSIDELSLVLRRSEQADMLLRISRCRRRSTQLSRLLTSKMDVIKSLIKRYEDRANGDLDDISEDPLTAKSKKAFSDVCLYLGDIQDHVVTMTQNIGHYNRILGRAHTNYLAQVNVELTETYSTTNMVMNRLTFLATVFVPLTVLCGLFGMNVEVPGQNYLDLNYFFWIMAGMSVYCTCATAWGKWLKLL